VCPSETLQDWYALAGIIFSKMNYFFNTGAEHINVPENRRNSVMFFPEDQDALRTHQQGCLLLSLNQLLSLSLPFYSMTLSSGYPPWICCMVRRYPRYFKTTGSRGQLI